MVERFVPKKWRGVKSLHIKGPETMALPIWLADELWVDEGDVLDEEVANKAIEANISKKRKAIVGGEAKADGKKRKAGEEDGEKRGKKQKLLPESNDDKLDKEIAQRREMLKKQKADATKAVKDDVPKATKKSKKVKAGSLEL